MGAAILGITANDLAAIKEQNVSQYLSSLTVKEQLYESYFDAASFKPYVFKIKAKEESYLNEMKVRCSVTQASPVDYVTESQHLIQLIQQNQMVM